MVKRNGFSNIFGHRNGNAHKKMLRRFNDLALGGMAQKIAVIHGTQPEVVKTVVVLKVNRIVQFAGVAVNQLKHSIVD